MTAFCKGYDPRRNTTPPPNPNPPIEPTYPVHVDFLQRQVALDPLSTYALSREFCRHPLSLWDALNRRQRLTLTEADNLAVRWGCRIEDLIIEQ